MLYRRVINLHVFEVKNSLFCTFLGPSEDVGEGLFWGLFFTSKGRVDCHFFVPKKTSRLVEKSWAKGSFFEDLLGKTLRRIFGNS